MKSEMTMTDEATTIYRCSGEDAREAVAREAGCEYGEVTLVCRAVVLAGPAMQVLGGHVYRVGDRLYRA